MTYSKEHRVRPLCRSRWARQYQFPSLFAEGLYAIIAGWSAASEDTLLCINAKLSMQGDMGKAESRSKERTLSFTVTAIIRDDENAKYASRSIWAGMVVSCLRASLKAFNSSKDSPERFREVR